MSGRKKNRKHRHGQPPHELLNELNSLRDLLGSEEEADIPLLDQVAETDKSGGADKTYQSAAPKPLTTPPPIAPPRPLQEADLPILFSPVDEEPVEDYTPLLSDADRELLRPLQNLPREDATPASATREPQRSNDEAVTGEAKVQPVELPPEPAREEFQPSLFDGPQKSTTASVTNGSKDSGDHSEEGVASAATPAATPAGTAAAGPEAAQEPVKKAPQKASGKAQRPLPAAVTENPFLPPHIRARLTGGRVPRSQEGTQAKDVTPQEPSVSAEPPEADSAPLESQSDAAHAAEASARERLIEQLMSEQLPELERQLRANITLMVNEIYPEVPESD
ncbi:hypothetical protein [Microbulbifer hydrolyticus]|uniref:Uncharacterized protein n=1 Tax=Microbulbifer hydrolyticus TaxID=48074 RepID=A0A6P1TCM2_9GAMM|nr:hypothetical protein [Microbulbifer hydrolyticus]MBB5212059.1 hypothetical protein [Microbulbifer hydrolyticus]QHQ39737.1 hypothetical protein GTQ55_12590 [Microbulbifer hydrolyticus]